MYLSPPKKDIFLLSQNNTVKPNKFNNYFLISLNAQTIFTTILDEKICNGY